MKFIDYLNEAKFSVKDTNEAMKLILNVISKRLGESFYRFGGENHFQEEYTKSNGDKGIGFRFLTDSGKMYRFNWSRMSNSNTFTSVDVWSKSKDFSLPDVTITFPENMNIVKSLDKIVKALKMNSGELDIDESVLRWEVLNSLEKDEEDSLDEEDEIVKKKRGRPKGSKNKIKVERGVKEKSTVTREIQTSQKQLDDTKFANVETIFEDIEDLTTIVATTKQPSLLITGMPGIGKTYIVTNILKKLLGPEGGEWIQIKGKTSTLGLYSTLFINRDKLIVFDDCDSVFSNQDAVNLLKGALDSYDTRTISWISPMTVNVQKLDKDAKNQFYEELERKLEDDPTSPKIKYPSQFEFTGKVIFISNLPESKLDSAIKSRSTTIDVTLKQQDVLKRIETILPYIGRWYKYWWKKRSAKLFEKRGRCWFNKRS